MELTVEMLKQYIHEAEAGTRKAVKYDEGSLIPQGLSYFDLKGARWWLFRVNDSYAKYHTEAGKEFFEHWV